MTSNKSIEEMMEEKFYGGLDIELVEESVNDPSIVKLWENTAKIDKYHTDMNNTTLMQCYRATGSMRVTDRAKKAFCTHINYVTKNDKGKIDVNDVRDVYVTVELRKLKDGKETKEIYTMVTTNSDNDTITEVLDKDATLRFLPMFYIDDPNENKEVKELLTEFKDRILVGEEVGKIQDMSDDELIDTHAQISFECTRGYGCPYSILLKSIVKDELRARLQNSKTI